ncbi:hypothetical protein FR741_08195 [Vibrio diabolicus]|nr:hypothetical protein FR741_08195 [Vibrio diabolicus]
MGWECRLGEINQSTRNDNLQIKAVWEGIAKKFNGLGLSGISMACTGLALVIASPQEPLYQCALYVLC